MWTSIRLQVLVAAAIAVNTLEAVVQPDDCTAYPCLIFEDNFDTLDFTKWQHEITAGGGGNWEFQYYTNNRTNSYVRDSKLHIKPTLTADKYSEGFVTSGNLELWGSYPANLCTGNAFYGCQRQGTPDNYVNPIQSARMRTVNSFSFRYGKLEVSAQMPKGDWIWPAIWLLPTYNEYGDWPASGEIDLVESRGNLNLTDESGNLMGHQHVGSTMHWGPAFEYNKFEMTGGGKTGDFADRFHKYGMEWDENQIKFFYDDVLVVTVDPGADGFWKYGKLDDELPPENNPWITGDKMAPFDKPFYLVLNVAVGGTLGYFPDSWTNSPHPKPWLDSSHFGPKDFYLKKDEWYPTWAPGENNGEQAAMKVDYVRVWKTNGETPQTTTSQTSGAGVNANSLFDLKKWLA